MNGSRLSRWYAASALMLMNVLVLLLVLNAAAWLWLAWRTPLQAGDPVTEKYGADKLASVYPDLDSAAVESLLHETWSRRYLYEPFTQFRERPYQGSYVNVDDNGFRHGAGQAAWPPPAGDINVFVFGGSTAFGYGVQDSQTIPAHLQVHLRDRLGETVNVYNFGRGFYFSTQERLLFEALLSAGHVPTLAIFIDGLNDFYHYDGKPLYTDLLSAYIAGGAKQRNVLYKLPVVRLFTTAPVRPDGAASVDSAAGIVHYDDPAVLDGVIRRYLDNKRAIEALARAYGVRPLFVWQPVPTYHYDNRYHLFAGSGYQRHNFSRFGYPRMRDWLDTHDPGGDFLWAADLQQGIEQPLYVDQVHYTGAFSDRLAEFITAYLVSTYYGEKPVPQESNTRSEGG